MKNSRPLINPLPKDIQVRELSRKNNMNRKAQNDQLKFKTENTKTKILQWINTLKFVMRKRFDMVEVAQFWKNPSVPFMIVSFKINIIVLLFGGIIIFDKLPPKIQLFYNPIDERWIPEDKTIHIIIVPIILLMVFLLQYRFIRLIFRTDKRLSITVSWIMTLMNTFLLIAILQITSFYS